MISGVSGNLCFSSAYLLKYMEISKLIIFSISENNKAFFPNAHKNVGFYTEIFRTLKAANYFAKCQFKLMRFYNFRF